MLKLDAGTGAVTWAQNFGGSGAYAFGEALAVDGSGNPYLGGTFQSANLTTPTLTKIGTLDAFVLKLDGGSGAVTWAQNFGGAALRVGGRSRSTDRATRIWAGPSSTPI